MSRNKNSREDHAYLQLLCIIPSSLFVFLLCEQIEPNSSSLRGELVWDLYF